MGKADKVCCLYSMDYYVIIKQTELLLVNINRSWEYFHNILPDEKKQALENYVSHPIFGKLEGISKKCLHSYLCTQQNLVYEHLMISRIQLSLQYYSVPEYVKGRKQREKVWIHSVLCCAPLLLSFIYHTILILSYKVLTTFQK